MFDYVTKSIRSHVIFIPKWSEFFSIHLII